MVQPINPLHAFTGATHSVLFNQATRLAANILKEGATCAIMYAAFRGTNAAVEAIAPEVSYLGLGMSLLFCTVPGILTDRAVGGSERVLGGIGALTRTRLGEILAGGIRTRAVAAGIVGVTLPMLGLLIASIVEREISKVEAKLDPTLSGNKAFCQAILHNYLIPIYRRREFSVLDAAAIDKFCKLVIKEMILGPEEPTEANTPAFIHPHLVAIHELRSLYQRLSAAEKRKFSLLGAPDHEQMSEDLYFVVGQGRQLAQRLTLARGDQAAWMRLINESI